MSMTILEEARLEHAAIEAQNVELNDERLRKRCVQIFEMLAGDPSRILSLAANGEAEAEAAHRFINNEKCHHRALLKPHLTATAQRVQREESVIVAHDTSYFIWETPRKGLPPLMQGYGFLFHAALVVMGDGSRVPLGMGGCRMLVRDDEGLEKDEARSVEWDTYEKESERWYDLALAVEKRLEHENVHHEMDSGADDYKTMAKMVEEDMSFTIRSGQSRVALRENGETSRLHDCLDEVTEYVMSYDVDISRHEDDLNTSGHQTSAGRRRTELEVRAGVVNLRRSDNLDADWPESLKLSVVRATEENPPKDLERPVDWILLTTKEVETAEDAREIIRGYERRWPFEEWMRTLKSHCATEGNRLRSSFSIIANLALKIPLSWRLMVLRSAAHGEIEARSSVLFEREQVQLLEELEERHEVALDGSLQQFTWALAGLGGHRRHNGPPGLVTIQRGLMRFYLIYIGYRVALAATSQSQKDLC